MLWIEPSVHITSSEENLKSTLHHARKTGVLLFGGRSRHTTFAVTHPQMYKFLVSDVKRLSATAQLFSAPLLIYNTKEVQEKLMHWWVLCSLDVRCIAPPGASKLGCKRLGKKGPAGIVRQKKGKNVKDMRRKRLCHMFDQSVLNILLKNLNNFHSSAFLSKTRISTNASRTLVKHHSIKQCKVAVKKVVKTGKKHH